MLNDRENILSALREKPLKVPPRADILGRAHQRTFGSDFPRSCLALQQGLPTRETRNSARDF